MPSFCVVLNCCDKYGFDKSISFHKFPFKRKDLLEKWIAFTQRGCLWKPTKWSAICSQHFIAEDFKCANSRKTLKKTAVPSVHVWQRQIGAGAAYSKDPKKRTPVRGKKLLTADAPAEHLEYDFEDGEEIPSTPDRTSRSTSNGPKVCCRFCGVCVCTAGTFSTNFEIFGMIQKCFPTLNIQQDDNLPKDMCNSCLERLKSFSEFIDKVLETQRDLQQKYRIEKHTKSIEQRPLKIKQEPVVVKVKQEVAEGFDSFLSDDLDVGIDDCCEPDPDLVSVDQKFGFCDFPIINAQDIINNCDIMEIINLDDPFINIPDDDAATINVTEQVGKTHMPSAHQLLQIHMIIDEHNYACPAEDLKEEWQIKKCCKTEETEADLYEPLEAIEAGCGHHYQNCTQAENAYVCSLQSELLGDFAVPERSAKPIVTSVSAIAKSRLDLNSGSVDNRSSSTAHTSINDLPPLMNSSKPENVATNKPNIVVLNESIVKSTEAFQLHACVACQLKFFSIESLQQHIKCIHDTVETAATSNAPMVSLPGENIMLSTESHSSENKDTTDETQASAQNATSPRNCDREEFLNLESAKLDENSITLCEHSRNLQSWQLNMKKVQLDALINTWTNESAASVNQPHEPLQQDSTAPQSIIIQAKALNTGVLDVVDATCSTKDVPTQDKDILLNTNAKATELTTESHDMNSPQCSSLRGLKDAVKKKSRAFRATFNSLALLSQQSASKGTQQQHVATDYKYLLRRYRVLLRQCKALAENCQVLARTNKGAVHHICPHCPTSFSSIYQLLQHKQRFHRSYKVHTSFSASCFGCEKWFLSKRALTNHMKYICQSMSLRWFKTQLQTFKCRSCRIISFTHWRLFRNHEIRCRRQMELKRLRKLQQCPICNRDFADAATLTLHMTAEHRARWQLRCEQCSSKFQRISAILQHHSKSACKLQSATALDCAVKCCNCQRSFRHISKILEHHNCRKRSMHANALYATAVKKQQQSLEPKLTQLPCKVCHKVFSSTNSLRQHGITHTQEKRHKCGLCSRSFKRRGGLTQHMKGFHLELKPYECPVCKHRYALKCDMQRCRHSILQRRIVDMENTAVQKQ